MGLKRCLWILGLFMLAIISGCGANPEGSPGSDTGDSGLVITSYGELGAQSYNAGMSVDVNDNPVAETFTTHLVTFSGLLIDYYDQYANTNQGVTFTRYTVVFSSDVTGAPALTSKTAYQTISVALDGAHSALISQPVELVGLETKAEFYSAITASPAAEDPVSYTATLTFYGTDWITGSDVETSFTVNIELADFDMSAF